MKCKNKVSSSYWVAILVIGFVVLILGVASQLNYLPIAENNDMFNGLLSGLGGGLFIVGIVMLIRNRLMSPQKRREEEIGLKDERNIAVSRAAMSAAYVAETIIFIAVVITLIWLKYSVPALIISGALVVQAIIFLIAYTVMNRKY